MEWFTSPWIGIPPLGKGECSYACGLCPTNPTACVRGGGVVELISEVFLGTDVLIPQMEADAQTIAAAWATPMGSVEELDSVLALEKDLDAKTRGQLVSTTSLGDVAEVVCSITLGSTGWSNGEWRCTYDDLSADGKALYDTMRRLYPTCTLHLATFLDT